MKLWLAVGALGLALSLASSASAAPASAVAPNWGAPVAFDFGHSEGHHLFAMSCPSSSLCVAGDDSGNVVTSTNPTGGASAWKSTKLGSEEIRTVACASTSLCVAVAGPGDRVFTSTNPTGGVSAWHEADGLVDTGNQGDVLTGLSCPSTSLCVATDLDGSVLSATNPTGGAGAWTRVPLNGAPNLLGISCPSPSLCVAVAGLGQVVTSTNPTGQAAAWNTVDADPHGFDRISCPSTSFCAAVDNDGNVVTSTAPTGDPSAWTGTSIGTSATTDISCPSASLCAVTDDAGDIVTSTNPTGGAADWSAAVVDLDTDISFAGGGVGPISCPSTSLCVAAGAFDGNALTSTDPAGEADAWLATPIDTFFAAVTNHPTGLSCPTTAFCAAVDAFGNVVTTTKPGGSASAWTVTHIDDRDMHVPEADILTAISCASASLCVAVDYLGDVITSTDPTGGAAAWTKTSIDPGHQLPAISCTSATLCVAVDDAGNAFASTDPAGGAANWTSTDADGSERLDSVSCATGPLCVAGDNNGQVVVTTNPTGNSPTWTLKAIPDSVHIMWAASCPTSSFCMVGSAGGTYVSDDPTGSASTWTGSAGGFSSLSCSSTSLCAAGGGTTVAVSTNPTATPLTWTDFDIVPGADQPRVSCPSDGMCMAVFDTGYAVAGLNPPSVSVGTAGSITTTGATLMGTVNPNGFDVTDCHFAYGPGANSGTPNNVPCNVSPGSGTSGVAVSANLTGLSPSTVYSYKLSASNAAGTAESSGFLTTDNAAPTPRKVMCVVPKVNGKTLAKAKRSIKSHHCSVGKITKVKSSKKKRGHVISQSPKPGKHLRKGAKVALKVGK